MHSNGGLGGDLDSAAHLVGDGDGDGPLGRRYSSWLPRGSVRVMFPRVLGDHLLEYQKKVPRAILIGPPGEGLCVRERGGGGGG